MAHSLRPWFMLLLLCTLFIVNQRVVGIVYSRNELLDIGRQLPKTTSQDIWNSQFKPLVKIVEPKIIKSRKRGKRAGIKTKLRLLKSRTALPGIILTNAQSIFSKLDELHALVNNSQKHLTQIISPSSITKAMNRESG